MRSGFLRISACPYQYESGSNALEETWFGADVATEPNGFAGVDVCIGALIEAAEIAPGTAHPPYCMRAQ